MAYDFNGSTQYLINDSWAGITTYPYTFACWCNLDTAGATLGALCATSANQSVYGLQARTDGPGNKIAAAAYDGGTFSAGYAASTYSTGSWIHSASVLSSATSRTAYFNGVSGTEDTINVPQVSIDRLVIGAYKQASTAAAEFTNGRIAEFAIWNIVLTADEISSLAKGYKPLRVRPQSLQFYAPLVADVRDFARGLALTNTNTATAAEHPRIY